MNLGDKIQVKVTDYSMSTSRFENMIKDATFVQWIGGLGNGSAVVKLDDRKTLSVHPADKIIVDLSMIEHHWKHIDILDRLDKLIIAIDNK